MDLAERRLAKPRPFDTVFQNLAILGFTNNLLIQLANQANAPAFASGDAVVEMPAGTTQVLAFMQGWLLGFGQFSPDGQTFTSGDDHHVQLEAAIVEVSNIDFPNSLAVITALMILRDSGGDKQWVGEAFADVLFLGPVGG
jgi:hypothetical protein